MRIHRAAAATARRKERRKWSVLARPPSSTVADRRSDHRRVPFCEMADDLADETFGSDRDKRDARQHHQELDVPHPTVKSKPQVTFSPSTAGGEPDAHSQSSSNDLKVLCRFFLPTIQRREQLRPCVVCAQTTVAACA